MCHLKKSIPGKPELPSQPRSEDVRLRKACGAGTVLGQEETMILSPQLSLVAFMLCLGPLCAGKFSLSLRRVCLLSEFIQSDTQNQPSWNSRSQGSYAYAHNVAWPILYGFVAISPLTALVTIDRVSHLPAKLSDDTLVVFLSRPLTAFSLRNYSSGVFCQSKCPLCS